MATLRTVTLVVGAGYGGSYLYNNATADSLKGLAADFLLRENRRPAGHGAAPGPDYSASAGLQALSAQVDRLSRDVQSSANRPVVVVSSDSAAGLLPDAVTLASWTLVGVTVGSVVYYYLVRKGYSVKDLMWVSRTAFHATVDSMQASVAKVSSSVAAVRRELTDKLRNIEHRVESVRAGLSKKIETEVADVKDAVDGVGRDVEGVQSMLQGVNQRMEMLDGKLDTATNGIVALVRVVSSLAPDNVPPNSAFSDLRRFAELTSAKQTAARLTSSSPPAFMKKQIRSSFAAAALEGASPDCSQSDLANSALGGLFSRRDSSPLPRTTSIS